MTMGDSLIFRGRGTERGTCVLRDVARGYEVRATHPISVRPSEVGRA